MRTELSHRLPARKMGTPFRPPSLCPPDTFQNLPLGPHLPIPAPSPESRSNKLVFVPAENTTARTCGARFFPRVGKVRNANTGRPVPDWITPHYQESGAGRNYNVRGPLLA